MHTYDILSDGTLCCRANDSGNEKFRWYSTQTRDGVIEIGFDRFFNAKRVRSEESVGFDVLITLDPGKIVLH